MNSLRLKLTLWFSIVMAVSLAVFGLLVYRSISDQLTTGLDLALGKAVQGLDTKIREVADEAQLTPRERRAKIAATTPNDTSQPEVEYFRGQDSTKSDSNAVVVSPIIPKQQLGANDKVWTSITEYVVLNPRNFMVQVMDSTGTTLYRSESLGSDTLRVPESLLADVDSGGTATYGTFSRTIPGADKDQQQSIRAAVARSRSVLLIVAYPYDELQGALDDLLQTLMWLIPAVLAISTIGGFYFARASLQPVDEITKTAQDITASNMSRRLPVRKTNDEISRLTETLNDMIGRLESSFGQIRQFTADASHELRTPLTILTGELELALRSARTSEEYQEVISSALQETLRMSHVVEDLLLLSRADMGKIQLKSEIVDLNEILTDLADATHILGAKKDLVITYRHSDGSLRVDGDPPRLYQMLLNLIDNAVKYTPHGGAITLTLHRDGNVAEIRIRDTGIGISREDQQKIFDRFYRVDKARSRAQGGVGLGLSIVEWTIRAHNGTIAVESEPNRGSTFIVRLPLVPDDTIPTDAPTHDETHDRQNPLVGALDHLPRFLKRRPHEPESSRNGEEHGNDRSERETKTEEDHRP